MTGAGLALLRARGADGVPHPGGTLGAHLARVAERLASYGAPEDVCAAGACHAAYGTDGFDRALLGPDERPVLRAAIGAAAEALVHDYGRCDRAATYPGLRGDPVRLVDRRTGRATLVDRADLRGFALLTVANELDVLEHGPPGPDDHRAVAALVDKLDDLLPPVARADAGRVLG